MPTHANPMPTALFAWFFIVFASVFILMGWTFAVFVILAGKNLGRQKRYTFCLVMGCVECLFFPFGTVLGVFTILVLNRENVKAMFGEKPRLNSES
jgi:hypothetical protein